MRRTDSGCGDSGAERTGVGRWDDRRERDSAMVGSGWLEARRAGTAVVCRGRGAERWVGWSCGRLEDHRAGSFEINRGKDDLDAAALPRGRVRCAGGGRRALSENDPGLVRALERLVEPATLGDPMAPSADNSIAVIQRRHAAD